MRKHLAYLFASLCCSLCITAQVTYSGHIASIIYNKCSSCHHAGDIGPMPLTSYEEVLKNADMIKYVTAKKIMPPWMPDTSYRHFLNERTLSSQEVEQIKTWIETGKARGDAAMEPDLPLFAKGSQLGKPDLSVGMQQAYTHKGDNQDEYRVFVLPTHLTEGRNVKAIEIVPGNPSIVHHIILGLDTTRYADKLDAKDAGYGYAQYAGFGFYPNYDNWSGWIPGNKTRFFPEGICNYVLPRSEVLLQMHYGPSAVEAKDSTVVNIFYAEQPAKRYIRTQIIGPNDIKDGPFFIPAGKVKTFHAEYKVVADYSLISITPHSHWLGKHWEVYAVSPRKDTTRLIKISDWDFNWQNFFSFPKPVKLEKGSVIHAIVTFDNTSDNEANPNNPPKNVTWGESARDEMFLCYFAYVPYQKGDETIDLTGKSNTLGIGMPGGAQTASISFTLADKGPVSLRLCNAGGKTEKQLIDQQTYEAGSHAYQLDTKGLPPGDYWCKLSTASYTCSKKLMIR